jgi:hypothetical protein
MTAAIVPRAEFRVFGRGIIEPVSARMWNGKTILQQARRMPPETYVLSTFTDDANVKIRNGLLDIKTKVGETPEGYEIFQPRGKFQFPVPREELAIILSHLGVSRVLEQSQYSLDAFLDLVRADPALVPVTVEKVRHGFTIDGIICEYAQVWFNGALVESACAESENYEGLGAVIHSLGIDALPNTNYLKAAKKVVGLS